MSHITRIANVIVAVPDQDAALAWFTQRLGFEQRADHVVAGVRWVTVAPVGLAAPELSLASWFPDKVGGNAPLIFNTDDCRAAHAQFSAAGVEFSEGPDDRPYGTVAVFHDPWGNEYVLVQPAAA